MQPSIVAVCTVLIVVSFSSVDCLAQTREQAMSSEPVVGDQGQPRNRGGSSPFAPPQQSDSVFVVDEGPGLDTGCTFSDAGPLEFSIMIDRFFGDVALLQANGLMEDTFLLRMPAFDVDFDAIVPPFQPERDRVFFNDHQVMEEFLTGSNGVWKLNTFRIPSDWINFPVDPSSGTVEPAENRIRIEIDVANPGQQVWCTAIDWAAIEIEAPLPVVMAHGILSSGATWSGTWVPGLDALGIPNSNSLNMGNLDSIQANAGKISDEVDSIRQRWGVDKVTLVCHSKGGLDSRHFAETSDYVSSVIQIGTPNAGSPLADLAQGIIVGSVGVLNAAIINALAGPAGVQLTEPYMDVYNRTHGSNPAVSYVALAGDYDPDCSIFFSLTCIGFNLLLAVTGAGDTIVPITSVHALGYTRDLFYQSSGLDDTSATHTGLNQSGDVFGGLVGFIAASTGSKSTLESPVELAGMQTGVTPFGAIATVETVSTSVFEIEEGEIQSSTFSIDEQKPSSFLLLYPSGDLDLSVRSPSGITYDEATTGNPDVSFGNGELFGGRFETVELANPEQGLWEVSVFGESVVEPSGRVPYAASALVRDPNLQLEGGFAEQHISVGDCLTFTGTLTRNGNPVTGESITSTVLLPDGSTESVALHDDGFGPDVSADDGIYSGDYLGTSQSGTYRVLFRAVGSNPAQFKRESFALATVSSSSSTFSGSYVDVGVDTDGDGLFNTLRIDVGVEIDSPREYRLLGELADSAGNIIASSFGEVLSSGPQTLSLHFDGSAIFANSVDGPYHLARAVLVEEDGLDIKLLDEVNNAYTTSPYSFDEFQHEPLIVVGNGDDAGLDTNGSGFFNLLHVDLEVDLQFSDFYSWTARLVDRDGREIGFAGNSASLSSGTAILSFDFDGEPIGANGVDGPYVVRDLLLFSSSQSLVAGEVYTTKSYLASQFEGFVPPTMVVDFENDEFGPLMNGQIPSFDSVFTLSSQGRNHGHAVYDSDPTGPNLSGDDPDLLVNQGMILILQENSYQSTPGTFDEPDDSALGGKLVFDFVGTTRLESIDLIDVCLSSSPQDVTLVLVDATGLRRTYYVPSGWTTDASVSGTGVGTLDLTLLGQQPGEYATAGGFETPGFDPNSVVSLRIRFAGSGAVDNLRITRQ